MKVATLILTALMLTGCGSTPALFSRSSVIIEVEKSPQNKIEHRVKPLGQKINQAMTEAQIPFKTQPRGQSEAMVELAGVISTSGKTWHLYIDNQPQPIETITQKDLSEPATISWRYEDINP